MLTYDFSSRGKTPMYEYLYNCIREDILSGNLKADQKLPSKREMASNHGISIITVQNAYEQLMVEGYIYSQEKKGYFVSKVDSGFKVEEPKKTSAPKKTAVHTKEEKPLVDFSSNHLLYDSFPFNTWSKIMRKTITDSEPDFLESPNHAGVEELRVAIANHLQDFRGMRVNPENIVVGAGMEYLYGFIVQLLGKNHMIAIEDPGHKKVGSVYESNGVKCIPIPVRDDGIDLDALKTSKAKVVHLSPSHHFPTGCVMPINNRTKLLEIVDHGFVIEDDYDSEFRFKGRPLPTLQSLNPDKVIYLNTFSKTLAPSIRIAYMVLPDVLMRVFNEKLSFYSSTVSSFDQYTLAKFISDGYYSRHINRMRNFYKGYRKTIIDELKKSPMSDRIKIREATSGLHFILELDLKVDDKKFVKALSDRGIKLKKVTDYCYLKNDNYKHQFIINYSAVQEDKLKKAFQIMSEELDKYGKKATKKVEKKQAAKTTKKKQTANKLANNIKIELPKEVKNIISILDKEGFEAFVVGGCVRDSILNRNPDDWDITTSAKPEDVKKIFNRTFDTGIEHGTVTVRMGGQSFEVTTYRIEGEYKDSRHPESVEFTSDLKEDLMRRDFTINAMAYNDQVGLVDEFGGIKDLENKIIKCVGNPTERFSEDALRILRAVRFAAQLGFDIDKETEDAMKELAPNLRNISAERIQTELEKLIMSDNPGMFIKVYELGITKVILPEFDRLMEQEQISIYHDHNVGVHTIKVLENTRKDKILRWTALLHDITKPDEESIDENGQHHFKNHPDSGAEVAKSIMKRLKMDNKTIRSVYHVILHHDDRPYSLDPESIRRNVHEIGKDYYDYFLAFSYADYMGKSEYAREVGFPMLKYCKEQFEEIKKKGYATSIKELKITGKDLIDLGAEPGEKIGEILEELLDMVLTEPEINIHEKLVKIAEKML